MSYQEVKIDLVSNAGVSTLNNFAAYLSKFKNESIQDKNQVSLDKI